MTTGIRAGDRVHQEPYLQRGTVVRVFDGAPQPVDGRLFMYRRRWADVKWDNGDRSPAILLTDLRKGMQGNVAAGSHVD